MVNICEQHAAIRFCFLLDRSATDAVDMWSIAYKEYALKKVFEWYSCFKRSDILLEDNQRLPRPESMKMLKNFTRSFTKTEGVMLLRFLNH